MPQEIRRPPGMPDDAWADYLQFVEQQQQAERGAMDDREGFWGTASDFGRGVATGVVQTGTSTIGGIGGLVGADGVRDWADDAGHDVTEFFDPRGTAGSVGRVVGRVAGEGALAMTGGGAAIRGASMAGKGGRALAAGAKALSASKSAAARTVGRALPAAPMEFAIGAGEAREGESAVGSGLKRVGMGLMGAYGLNRLGQRLNPGRFSGAADAPPPPPSSVAPSGAGTVNIRGLLPGGARVMGPEGAGQFSMAAPGRQVELTFIEDEVNRLLKEQIEGNAQYWLGLGEDVQRKAVEGLRHAIRARVMMSRGLSG